VELAEQGNLTGGCKRNRDFLSDKVAVAPSVGAGLVEIAYDPQTSGGLLIAVPQPEATALVDRLHAGGVDAAAVVGRAEAHQDVWVRLE
jgi:selenide,water dikinase